MAPPANTSERVEMSAESEEPLPGDFMLESLREAERHGWDPEDVIRLAASRPFVVHGVTVLITRASCHCGGDWAWAHRRESGAWEMKGCVCHNPAVGP